MRFLKKLIKVFALFCNPLTLKQILYPKSIPFIIINFNQLFYLEKLVDFAINRGFAQIIIIDNLSTYPPLLAYYKTLEINKRIKVVRMIENTGHMVFFENKELYNQYGKGFFILSDADIVPNENLPDNFMKTLMYWLFKRYDQVTKVGFAMNLEDIPDYYPQKNKVQLYEKKFWEKRIADNVYFAQIDTTFALYKPDFKKHSKHRTDFYNAVRVAGNFIAKHGGWYIDYNNPTNEQQFYLNTATKVSTWAANQGENLKT